MPMDKSRYPSNWDSISWRIRFVRARGICEECGVPHGATIRRSTVNPAYYLELGADDCWYTPGGDIVRVSEMPGEFAGSKAVKVFLTTHHIGVTKPDGTPGSPHDKMDCRDENLAALCQRCHFIADLPIHIVGARESRIRNKHLRKIKAGQKELW